MCLPNRIFPSVVFVSGFILNLIAFPAFAQTASELEAAQRQSDQIIQQQQQQLEFERRAIEQQRERVIIESPLVPDEVPSPQSGSRCFPIEVINVRGVNKFAEADIEAITNPYVQQCLGLDKINLILKAMTTLYLEQGFA